MKKIIIIVSTILLLIAGSAAYLFFTKPDYGGLNFIHKHFTKNIYEKWEAKINSLPADLRAAIDYDTLMNELNFIERNFAERIFSINPKELGFKGPFYSRKKPADLVKVESIKSVREKT